MLDNMQDFLGVQWCLLLDTSHKERRKEGKEGKKGQERGKNNYSRTKQTKKKFYIYIYELL